MAPWVPSLAPPLLAGLQVLSELVSISVLRSLILVSVSSVPVSRVVPEESDWPLGDRDKR